MKTLGQIAREAFDATPVDYTKTFDKQDAMWEAAAQAVRAAVIEEFNGWVAEGDLLLSKPERWNVWMAIGAWWSDRPWREARDEK